MLTPCCIWKEIPSQGEGEQFTKLGGPCAYWPHPALACTPLNDVPLCAAGPDVTVVGFWEPPRPGETPAHAVRAASDNRSTMKTGCQQNDLPAYTSGKWMDRGQNIDHHLVKLFFGTTRRAPGENLVDCSEGLYPGIEDIARSRMVHVRTDRRTRELFSLSLFRRSLREPRWPFWQRFSLTSYDLYGFLFAFLFAFRDFHQPRILLAHPRILEDCGAGFAPARLDRAAWLRAPERS